MNSDTGLVTITFPFYVLTYARRGATFSHAASEAGPDLTEA